MAKVKIPKEYRELVKMANTIVTKAYTGVSPTDSEILILQMCIRLLEDTEHIATGIDGIEVTQIKYESTPVS